ncbi:MAG: hypothetical protein QF412_12375, partial [Planctomycetota bacterium]|nr:hypothetical protein [Planctomycetota bacterium]
MKSSRFPHSLALIFGMIIIAQLLTYVIPSGEYEKGSKKTPLSATERTIALPAGRKLLLADERHILLADGQRIELPDGCRLRLGDGREIALGKDRRIIIDGEPLTLPGVRTFVGTDGGLVHIPEDNVIDLPAGTRTSLANGREAFALDGDEITLPEGSYRTEPDRAIIASSFRYLEPDEVPPRDHFAFVSKILKGMMEAADIIFFVFIVGGVIAVIRATGAIDALIGAAIRSFGHNRLLLVAGMVTLFAIGSSTIGMAEEYMPFIPILVAMCLALKLDAVVAMGIVYIGAGIGYGCAALNPFTVAIAKKIAGAEITTGMHWRWILLAVMIAIGVHHILRYCRKITADPQQSLVADLDYSKGFAMAEDQKLTGRRILVLVAFVLGIAGFVVGAAVTEGDWFVAELSAIFLGLALISAIIARISPNEVCTKFCIGAAEMTTTALLIGFARTIEVVLTDAKIIHTIIDSISGLLNQMNSPALAADGMLIVQSVCNFLIPSGSGQAYVTMPIMAPVAELTNVGKETAIFAY